MLTDLSAKNLLDALSSPEPTPGGGSASALAGAVGVSLLMKVAALPRTRHSTDEDRAALTDARDQLTTLRDRLGALIDRDAEAYGLVVAAYRRPKGTEDERGARAEAIQAALARAIDAPGAVLECARQALALAARVAECGSPAAASDVEVAVTLLTAAMHGAYVNVTTNADGLADRRTATGLREEASALVAAGAEDGEHARRLLPRRT